MSTAPLRTAPHHPAVRAILVGLELLTAVGALAGGIGLIAGNALGMPDDWLTGTAWNTWTWPGVLLLLVVATPMVLAAAAELRGAREAWLLSLLAGLMQVGWIVAEWVAFGRYHWLQPTFLAVGLVVAGLAWWSSRGAARSRPHPAARP